MKISNLQITKGSIIFLKSEILNDNKSKEYLKNRPLIVVSEHIKLYNSIMVCECGSRKRPGIPIYLHSYRTGFPLGDNDCTNVYPHALTTISLYDIESSIGILDPQIIKEIDKSIDFFLGRTEEIPRYLKPYESLFTYSYEIPKYNIENFSRIYNNEKFSNEFIQDLYSLSNPLIYQETLQVLPELPDKVDNEYEQEILDETPNDNEKFENNSNNNLTETDSSSEIIEENSSIESEESNDDNNEVKDEMEIINEEITNHAEAKKKIYQLIYDFIKSHYEYKEGEKIFKHDKKNSIIQYAEETNNELLIDFMNNYNHISVGKMIGRAISENFPNVVTTSVCYFKDTKTCKPAFNNLSIIKQPLIIPNSDPNAEYKSKFSISDLSLEIVTWTMEEKFLNNVSSVSDLLNQLSDDDILYIVSRKASLAAIDYKFYRGNSIEAAKNIRDILTDYAIESANYKITRKISFYNLKSYEKAAMSILYHKNALPNLDTKNMIKLKSGIIEFTKSLGLKFKNKTLWGDIIK